MKNTSIYLLVLVVLLLAGCEKDEVQAIYSGGTAPTLSASASDILMTPADTARTVLSLNWTDPNYTVDGERSTHAVNYTVNIDLASNNFTAPKQITVTDQNSLSFTGLALNALMSDLGLEDTTQTYALSAMVTSSLYVNSTALNSNVLGMNIKPFSTKPTAKYPVPDNLYLVGDATVGGWNNPVPEPGQKFTKLDEFTFGGIFQLTGGNKYLFLPVNGDWGHKYASPDGGAAGASESGDFIVDDGQDIPAPATSGLYKIVVDFIRGKYTVTEITQTPDMPPADLFIVGDATAGGWNNPVPVPSQQFTQVSNSGFEITVQLGSGNYLLLPVNGSWDHKYAIADASVSGASSGGSLVVDSGQDIPAPGESAMYRIFVEFINKTYTVTKL
ncbi:MAG: SusE domain-containing protein [Saprospiraceae bacterium]|nr:SusE domain-containing protein [Lewinella sp.]